MGTIRKRLSLEAKCELTIQEGIDDFIKHCKVRNYVQDTINSYIYSMRKFGTYYDLSNKLSGITIEITEGYILSLQGQNLTEYSISSHLKSLRTVLYFFMSKDWLKPFMVKLPKAEKKLKETYTDTELSLLLKKPIIKKVPFSEYRNWVMVNFLIGTGVRLNSLINIKIEDLDLDSDVVKLTKTKARNQVILPLSGSLVQILKEYLNYRKGEEDGFLFCSQYGEQLTKDGTENIIQKYNHARGVNKSSIHLFRHSFAKRYLLNGGDIFRLQKLMCHKDIRSTQQYINLCTDDLKVNYDNINPLEQFINKRQYIKIDRR